MTIPASPLAAEPADAESRKQQHLPQKSFADAVQGGSANGEANAPHVDEPGKSTNGSTIGTGPDAAKDKPLTDLPGAKVLRIVDTNGKKESPSNGTADKVAKKQNDTNRPEAERRESRREYSATGLDESSKSPPRSRHRRSASQKSKDSKPEDSRHIYETPDDLPRASDLNSENTVLFEEYEDKEKREGLVSIKPTDNYEELQHGRKEPHEEKYDENSLVSGRQAGKNWERSKIHFAPWNVPLQRRLQTLVVLFHTLCIATSLSGFFFLCAIPIMWPFLIPYLLYCLFSREATSGELKRRSNYLRSLRVWSLFASYFPARLHRTTELLPTRKYIFGYHPHGIISHGAFAAFGTEALGFSQLFPGITNTLLTLDSNFRMPLYRDYALAMGLASVSRESCENLLTKGGPNGEGMGRAITIVVGGARESLDAKPYTLNLVLKKRFGFIKIAVRTGADLVPVLAFGENDLYDQFLPDEHPQIHKMQLLVKKIFGFTIPLFHARGVFNYDIGLMPYRRPLNIVVGSPIKVVQQANPDPKELSRLHAAYMMELQRLWDSWKDEFSKNRKTELAFVE